MKIIEANPPMYNELVKAFPELANQPNGVFTYGDVIYNPSGKELPDYLIEHESIHTDQQTMYPGGPRAWWARYLVDAEFRFEEELEAYRYEYKAFCREHKDRNQQFNFLRFQSMMISSSMYGNMVPASKAMKEIKQ